MTLRRVRTYVVLCGLLSAIAGFVNGIYHLPWIAGFLSILLPFALVSYPARQLRKSRSDTIYIARSRFVLPADPSELTIFYMVAFFFGLRAPQSLLGALAIILILSPVALGLLYVLGYTSMALTESAVIVRRVIFRKTIAWEDISYENVLLRHDKRERYLRLGPGKTEVMCRTLLIKPESLLGLTEHYLRHPEHRAAIGTKEELRSVIANGYGASRDSADTN